MGWFKHFFSPKENFVLICGGEFTMGSPVGEVNRQNDETLHQVRVSDFYMCRNAVNVAQFRRFVELSGYQTEYSGESVPGIPGESVPPIPWQSVPLFQARFVVRIYIIFSNFFLLNDSPFSSSR